MAADLGLVAHAAQRHAHELAAQRPRDALAEARLADAGRPDEAEDRLARRRSPAPRGAAASAGPSPSPAAAPARSPLLAELLDREVLEDAVLDLLQVVVVLVEHPPGAGRRSPRRRACSRAAPPSTRGRCGSCRARARPRDAGRAGRARARPRAAPPRAARASSSLAAQLGDLAPPPSLLAQLVLDRAQLLAQVVLALRLGQPLLRLGRDLAARARARRARAGAGRRGGGASRPPGPARGSPVAPPARAASSSAMR